MVLFLKMEKQVSCAMKKFHDGTKLFIQGRTGSNCEELHRPSQDSVPVQLNGNEIQCT